MGFKGIGSNRSILEGSRLTDSRPSSSVIIWVRRECACPTDDGRAFLNDSSNNHKGQTVEVFTVF